MVCVTIFDFGIIHQTNFVINNIAVVTTNRHSVQLGNSQLGKKIIYFRVAFGLGLAFTRVLV